MVTFYQTGDLGFWSTDNRAGENYIQSLIFFLLLKRGALLSPGLNMQVGGLNQGT